MIEYPKPSVAELEKLNAALLEANKVLLQQISELRAEQTTSAGAQELANDVSRAEARALFDFFMQVTHYDFCGDNPNDLRKALNAQSTVSKLLGAHIERQLPLVGQSSNGGVGNMRVRVDPESGDLVGYFAKPAAQTVADEQRQLLSDVVGAIESSFGKEPLQPTPTEEPALPSRPVPWLELVSFDAAESGTSVWKGQPAERFTDIVNAHTHILMGP